MSNISIPKNIFEQIFFKEGGQKDVAKAAVGEYQYGLNKENPIAKPNAEVEKGEYVKDSQGIREFLGDTHENGGVLVKLEDGAKILSDHLTIGNDVAKMVKKELKLTVSPKDTFAKVLKKYTKMIGLEEVNLELEDLIKKLDKQQKETKDKGTLALNVQLLANEINEETKEKKPLEEARDGLFDFLFKAQEGQKEKEKIKTKFEEGGMYNSDVIMSIANKYGISPERAYELLPKYKDGGGTEFSATEGDNVYKGLPRKPVTQPARKEEGFGEISINESLQSLMNNFPDLVMDEAIFKNDIEVVDGVPKFKNKLTLNQQNKKVLALQKAMDKRMKSSAKLIIDNPKDFSADTVAKAQKYLDNETFIEGSAKSADKALTRRDYDEKWGEFTAGRFILGLDVVTPEEKAMLAKEGIRNLKQLKGSPLRDKLSKSSLDKISRVEKLGADKDFDFSLNTYTGQAPAEVSGQQPISGELPGVKVNKKLGLFAPPQNFRLTPSQWQHTTVDFRDRPIDPVLMSPEQQLSEISRANLSQQKQIEMLPDSAKAAVLAGSGTQEAIQKSVTDVNRFNAQAKYSADVYNAQQKTATDTRNAQEALRFDQVSALAADRYRQDWQNYFTATDNDRRRNFDYAMNLNAYNALNPNVQFTGIDYEIQDPNLHYADLLRAKQAADGSVDAKGGAKKTTIAKKGGRFKKSN
jgi:hypothetical protein